MTELPERGERQEAEGRSEGGGAGRVVYEVEPGDHGVAARALPKVSVPFLRQALGELAQTSDDFNGFVVDRFASVARQFGSGMTREARENVLFERATPFAVYDALRAAFGAKVPLPLVEVEAGSGSSRTLPNPYRGLLAFGVLDAPLFFGRTNQTTELRRLLEATVQQAGLSRGEGRDGAGSVRLVAVLGPSGSGKSSLVQAGLLADLRRKAPVWGTYGAAVLRPQGRPLRALARVLAKFKRPTQDWPVSHIDELVAQLRSRPQVLGDLLSDVLCVPSQRFLLVIDQLEELYSMADEKDETGEATADRKAFVAAVLSAASEPKGRCDVVVTLRTDLFGELEADPALLRVVTTPGRALLLGALDADELAEAVAGPAARAGRPLPADAVGLLSQQAVGQAGALPLLQFTLAQLWDKLDANRAVADCLRELGGVGGALAQEAESLYQGLASLLAQPAASRSPVPTPSPSQVRLRRVFVRLVRTRGGQVLGRRRQALADLVGDGETLLQVRDLLDPFVKNRLLVLDGEGPEAVVEIGHELLSRSWPRLAGWLTEAEAYLPVLLHLSDEARRWEKQGRPGHLLWRGEDLRELRGLLPILLQSGNLGARERQFAQASVDGVKLRRKRRADAEAKAAAMRAIGVARHVVDRVVTRLEKQPGTAKLRKELLADVMQEMDALCIESSGEHSTELLSLRARSHRKRGDIAIKHDNLTVAQAAYEAARLLGKQLLSQQPNSPQAQRDLSISLNKLGEVSVKRGQLEEAQKLFARSLQLGERLAKADETDAQAQRDLLVSHYKLAVVFAQRRQREAARAQVRVAADLLQKLRPRLPKPDADSLDRALTALEASLKKP